ncbi:MAG: hypothetical protein IKW64_02295 [Clostridia bacterium]|nr:hypothetical protein [Clostridia bacterium]
MMKKVMRIIISVAVVVTIIYVVKTFIPHSVADLGVEEVVRVQANLNYLKTDSKLIDVHFIPNRIIECLSKYKEQRTFTRYKGYSMKNVQMSILIRTNAGLKEIVIGSDTYCQHGSGPSYRILDTEEFKKEIFDVCGYVEEISEDKGSTRQFAYNNLKVEVTNVYETKTQTASDGFDSWEYAVYVVYPGAKVSIKNADMWLDDEGNKRSNWAFCKKNDERIYIADDMQDVEVTEDLVGIYDTESSVFVLQFSGY